MSVGYFCRVGNSNWIGNLNRNSYLLFTDILNVRVTHLLVMLLLHHLVSRVAVLSFCRFTFLLWLIFENHLAVLSHSGPAPLLDLRPDLDHRVAVEVDDLLALLTRSCFRSQIRAKVFHTIAVVQCVSPCVATLQDWRRELIGILGSLIETKTSSSWQTKERISSGASSLR